MVEPDAFINEAVIVVAPLATGVALPAEPAALLTVAIDGDDELHITAFVIFWVLLSENIPVAVNCCIVPTATVGFEGVTAMDTSETVDTVRLVDPEILPEVADITVVPAVPDVAFPFVPAIVATDGAEELHVTAEVRS